MAIAPSLVPADVVAHSIELRREIHRYPEPGFEEERTAALIERELSALGIKYRRIAKTAVVGVIDGAKPGRVAGLRADMDCLTLTERSGESFASERPGLMHACGHDAHTAMLLGAARVLQASREALSGKTVLLFQPAEEGPGGALPMIAEGALENPHVDAVTMLHVDTRLETGTIGVSGGPVNAAADEFHITITGQGGHGSAPHMAADAIPAAAAAVLALQNIAARETDPLKSVVVTVGTIEGGYRNNIIADRVFMTGTFRSQEQEIRDGLEARARRILEGIASAYNVKADIKVIYGYPAVINDRPLAEAFAERMSRRGCVQVVSPPPTMGGEDFAYFAQRVPGVMVRLGIRNEAKGCIYSAHSPEFKVDEDALAHGIATLVEFARGIGAGELPIESDRLHACI